MEELGRNSRAPVLLGTVQFGTTHKLTLHLQIARKGVIYKEVCLGKLPRHNSLDKRLKPSSQEDDHEQEVLQSSWEENGGVGRGPGGQSAGIQEMPHQGGWWQDRCAAIMPYIWP